MRIVTWNVAHQTRKREMSPRVAAGLIGLTPDVVVLTEYVHQDSHKACLDALALAGLSHVEMSSYVPGQNQVLIASRSRVSRGTITCDVGLSAASAPNWLHVRTSDGDNIIGFRRPMYPGVAEANAKYWAWLADAIEPLLDSRTVLVGDFNCNARARCLKKPTARGWAVASPTTGWSYCGKNGRESAIDLALLSPRTILRTATYEPSVGAFAFVGSAGSYSDHAPLVLDIQ